MTLTLNQLKDKYFLKVTDLPAGSRLPMEHDGSVARAIVDGEEFFQTIYDEIQLLKGAPANAQYRDFIYIANWVFDANINLPNPKVQNLDFLQILGLKAQQGVDVRVLLWFGAMGFPDMLSRSLRWYYDKPEERAYLAQLGKVAARRDISKQNFESAQGLRLVRSLKNKVLLDYGAHPLGSHHMKVVSIYNATTDKLVSYCGGMDFSPDRWGQVGHETGCPLLIPGDIPAPTVTDAGSGQLIQGIYEVQYFIMSKLGGKTQLTVSARSTITITNPSRKILVSDLGLASGPAITLMRLVGVRRVAGNDLLRLAAKIEDTTVTSVEITSNVQYEDGEELIGMEWHDLAIRLEGQAAGTVAEYIRLRWNDVLNYRPLDLLEPIGKENTVLAQANIRGHDEALPPPVLTKGSGGALPADSYEVFYTLNADSGALELSCSSKSSTIELPANSKLTISKLVLGIDGTVTKNRQVWISRVNSSNDPYLAMEVTDSALESVEISTAPATGTVRFPSENYTAKPIDPVDKTVKGSPVPSGQQSMQVLVTVADISAPLKWALGFPQQYSFAPNGEFTVYHGYKKAIGAANKYIYIEDQAMSSTQLMDLIAERMLGPGGAPDLIVLMVTSGKADPADKNMEDLTPSQLNMSIYDRLISKLPASKQGNVRLFRARGLTVHSKLCIIDDEWAAIGSANALNRSYSTDTEMQISIVDGANGLPLELRKRLWAEHLSIDSASTIHPFLDNIDNALWLWHPSWGTDPGVTPSSIPLLRRVAEVPLPFNVSNPGLLTSRYWMIRLADWSTTS
jgi:hypothetical protein